MARRLRHRQTKGPATDGPDLNSEATDAATRQRSGKAQCQTPDMYAKRESDESIVPAKRANKTGPSRAETPAAESVEERGSTKRNARPATTPRTLSRTDREEALARVRAVAARDKQVQFTALLHHVNEAMLVESFYALKREAAPGIDEVTWRQYERDLRAKVADLHARVHRGSYRASPVKRVWIPKADGRQRPLGIATLEDKIVQQAVVTVLTQIYEEDFLGFSYGYRPGRAQHQALDAVSVGITRKKVNWILDADIQGFFDNLDHEWMLKFLQHRIADKRILRLVRKWLTAGVSEDGKRSKTTVGTPQGTVISPLLANIYLHYVLDLWVDWWRAKHARGDVIIVRYADDFIVGFQHRSDAEHFRRALDQRLAKFGLSLHTEKTRLIEFGRYAAKNRRDRGDGKPETFDFLGLTHLCGQSRKGWFCVERRTAGKRMRSKLQELKMQLRRRMHWPIRKVGAWLKSVLRGWFHYHAVPGNILRLRQFRRALSKLWRQTLRRRSQKGTKWNWARFNRICDPWIPYPKLAHPWPQQRLLVDLR